MVLSLDSLPLDVKSEVLLAPHCPVCTLCWHVPLIGSAGTLCGTRHWHALCGSSAHAIVRYGCTISTQPATDDLFSLLLFSRSSARCRMLALPWLLHDPQPGRLT